MSHKTEEHRQLVLDQFTRQAVPFSRMSGHSDELVRASARVGPEDVALDVACGPGLTTCALAAVARHATGIDLTPAMVTRAEEAGRATGLTNVSWLVGDVVPLPFPDASFSLVYTRYSFHHLLDPGAVLAEMVRTCAAGGRVVVVDVFTTTAEQAEAYNRMELVRDPSHVRALPIDELVGLFHAAGLQGVTTRFYRHEMELEAVLAASFPGPGGADEVRRIFAADVGVDRLGVGATYRGGGIRLAYPVAVVLGRKG